MHPKRKKTPSTNGPEFIVTRIVFDRYFDPPLPRATFYDRVSAGLIYPWPHIAGRFYLNASLRKLGLPIVTKLPEGISSRSLEDVTRLAFTLLDPMIFPAPPWLLHTNILDAMTADHVLRIAAQHRDNIRSLLTTEEKLGYFGGVLDAIALRETER